MARVLLSLLALLAVGYCAVCGLLFVSQRKLLYFPTPESRIRAPGVEHIAIESGGERLAGWRVNPGRERALLYFGGNAEDISANFPEIAAAIPDRTIYLLHYRGYGGSTGTPTEEGLFLDALAAFDTFSPEHGSLAAAGRSLGSGVAVYLAAQRPVERLVLVTPYDSIQNVARRSFPIFPISLLLRDKFDSARRAGDLAVPTLLLLAEHDEIIPRASSERLRRSFRETEPETVIIPGATHNSISASPAYWSSIRDFLGRSGTAP